MDTLYIELTNRCNVQCRMCFRHQMKRAIGDMDFNRYDDILRMAKDAGFKRIRLQMYGDPLLYNRLVEAINLAVDYYRFDYVDFNTNSAALDSDLSEGLLNTRLNQIIFSVTGMSQEVYEQFQGYKSSYTLEHVSKNILGFLDLKQKHKNKHLKTIMQYIYTPESKKDIKEYIDFWCNKVDDISISFLMSVFGNIKGVLNNEEKHVRCFHLGNELAVLVNGDVTTCCVDYLGSNSIGNLNQMNLGEVISSQVLQEQIRNNNNLKVDKLFSLCKRCDFIKHSDSKMIPYSVVSRYRSVIERLEAREYCLWGANDNASLFLYCLNLLRDDINDIKIVDSFKQGDFYGYDIVKPEESLIRNRYTIVFVDKQFNEVKPILDMWGGKYKSFYELLCDNK